ncbi:MAG TPA: hypothetical protein VMM12_17430 [Longimicrobiales bacterium]|nr:hypothetical protein [Longimicrobiales bacterium]
MAARLRTSHHRSSASARAMAVLCSAIRSERSSFPNHGSICMAWIDGAMEVGMSVSRPGTEKFMMPTWSIGSGGSPADASRVATASATAAAARSIGLRVRASSYACSIVRGGTSVAGVSCAAAPAGTMPVASRARLPIRRFIVCFMIPFLNRLRAAWLRRWQESRSGDVKRP